MSEHEDRSAVGAPWQGHEHEAPARPQPLADLVEQAASIAERLPGLLRVRLTDGAACVELEWAAPVTATPVPAATPAAAAVSSEPTAPTEPAAPTAGRHRRAPAAEEGPASPR